MKKFRHITCLVGAFLGVAAVMPVAAFAHGGDHHHRSGHHSGAPQYRVDLPGASLFLGQAYEPRRHVRGSWGRKHHRRSFSGYRNKHREYRRFQKKQHRKLQRKLERNARRYHYQNGYRAGHKNAHGRAQKQGREHNTGKGRRDERRDQLRNRW